MRKLLLSCFATALLLPAFAMPSAACDPKSELVTAAAEAGVPIYPEELMVMVHGENTFAVAPVKGFENAPAGALSGGSDMAFAYIDFPGSTIPTGNYTLRPKAPEDSIHPGEYEGTLDLVSTAGDVVASLPLKMNTFSMTVPNPLPYPRTVITGAWKMGEEPDSSSASATAQVKPVPAHHGRPGIITDKMIYFPPQERPVRYMTVFWLCPNGTLFIFEYRI